MNNTSNNNHGNCLNCRTVLTARDYELMAAEYRINGISNPEKYLDEGFLCAACNRAYEAHQNHTSSLESVYF